MERYTVRRFNEDFPDDEACLLHVAALVYPTVLEDGTIPCRSVKCGGEYTKHHRLRRRRAFTCDRCGTHVYPLAGTIFEKSTTSLKSWFYAMYLMSSTRMGISAKQLERELGVTYKTAWRMFKQIRALMDEDGEPLTGIVEVDETFYGGKPRYRQGPGDDRPRDEYGRVKRGPRPRTRPDAKQPIVGMLQRGGSVKAWVKPNVQTRTIRPLIEDHVEPASTVYTDDARQYGLLGKSGYTHKRVRHSARIYVDGPVHTNSIEGFWSLLKNGIRGTYRQVGTDYLQTYVNEYVFRFNHRNDHAAMFRTVTNRVRAVRAGALGVYHPLG